MAMIRKTATDQQPTVPELVLETNDDPAHAEAVRAQRERTGRNSDWLVGHWPELLPAARGRHIAVSGQQAFVADTPEEAWRMARAAHPDDDGAILQYVPKTTAPRIYANRG
jgi:hypothetical protein